MSKFRGLLLTLGLFTAVSNVQAAAIDVLWLGGTTTYNSGIGTLGTGGSNDASTWDPDGDGSNTWNIDFWTGGTPILSNYDALVIGSTCEPDCGGSNGFYSLGVQPDLVLAHKDEISAARGNRTFVSGQDADWHFLNDSAGDSADARGFLIDAVNWAASGTGMGIVVLADGVGGQAAGSGWIDDDDSFLKDEIGSARVFSNEENVIIPADSADFPVNEGLTTASLSDWGTSSHTAFVKDELPTGWKAINDYETDGNDWAVTIVTASEASGGTSGKVPVPAPLGLMLLGLVGILLRRK